MEIDGQVSEISGDEGIICYTQRDLEDRLKNKNAESHGEIKLGENNAEIETIVADSKCKRLDNESDMETNGLRLLSASSQLNGPKYGKEAGPVVQARLEK